MAGDALNQIAMARVRYGADGLFVGKGATAARPTLTANDTGAWYFDTTLGYPVWWTGAAWHNGAGTAA